MLEDKPVYVESIFYFLCYLYVYVYFYLSTPSLYEE